MEISVKVIRTCNTAAGLFFLCSGVAMIYGGWNLSQLSRSLGPLLFLGLVGIIAIWMSVLHFCNAILGRDRFLTGKQGGKQ